MKLRLLLILILVIGSLMLGKTAYAQTSANYPISTNPDVPQNYHTYTQSVIIELASALSCQISGVDPTSPSTKCLGVDPQTGRIGYVESGGGLIGITGNSIAGMFNIPVSSTQYGMYLAENFGIAKKTYAQAEPQEFEKPQEGSSSFGNGVGFVKLESLLPLWKVFRNVVYVLFIIIFVIIGVGIMFRVKIDPRTVMNIQNQIPKIIIALILVTFSYAIAGFLIDMMYVFIYLIYNTVASARIIDISNFSPANIQGSNPVQAVGFFGGMKIATNAAFGLGTILASLFDGNTGRLISGIVGGLIGGGAALTLPFFGPAAGIIGGTAGGLLFGSSLLGVVGGLVAFLVISAALLSALFRLWFQLIKTYVSILINILLAPFWIAGGLIPSSPISFSGWMKDMIANLSSFPVTLFMLLMGKVLVDQIDKGGSSQNFIPPFIGNPSNAKNFEALIGLGIILLTPNVVNLIRQAIKAPQSKVTAGIGQSLSIGGGLVNVPAQAVGKRVWGVDPYTKEARPLTARVQRRLGDFTSKGGALDNVRAAAAKGFQTVTGAQTPQQRAEKNADQEILNRQVLERRTREAAARSAATNAATPPNNTNEAPTPEQQAEIQQEAQRREEMDDNSPEKNSGEALTNAIRELTARIDRLSPEERRELNILNSQNRIRRRAAGLPEEEEENNNEDNTP